MSEEQFKHFNLLKDELLKRVSERLSIQKDFANWSLSNIADFRADLEEECKSSISEKWFYTHLKNGSDKLPRIDTLNLLAQYVGYKNWDVFVQENASSKGAKFTKETLLGLVLALALIFSSVYVLLQDDGADLIKVEFVDAYTQNTVLQSQLLIQDLSGSNVQMKDGVMRKTSADTLVIRGPYYKRKVVPLPTLQDTLTVRLFPDDYALMLNFFSRSSTEDWERRREQLEAAIHPDAKIFQSHPELSGIEMLNKEEFIFRLTLPINRLKNLQIQDIVYKDDQIYRLRFTQNMEEDEN